MDEEAYDRQENQDYKCVTCLDTGCVACQREPWPMELWVDMADEELQGLVLDGLDELLRRNEVLYSLETQWNL